jgi:hypothetical protein
MKQFNNPNEDTNKLSSFMVRPFDNFTTQKQAQEPNTQVTSAKALKHILPISKSASALCLIAVVIALMSAWNSLSNKTDMGLEQTLTSPQEVDFGLLRF